MGEWQKRSLADAASFLNGFAFGPAHWGSRGLPIIRIEQMLNTDASTDRFEGPVPEHNKIDTGDLVMSWSGTIEVVKWYRGPALLNQHLFKVEPNSGVDRAFLFHLLRNSLPGIAARAHGTTMRHIRRGDLARLEVALPPSEEQRRIADILDTIDEAIRASERLIVKLKSVRKGALATEIAAAIGVAGTKVMPLGEAVEAPICYGIVQPGPSVPNGVPMVAIRDLNGNLENLHLVAPSLDAQYARSRIQGGDVLLSIKGTIGRTAVVTEGFAGNISRDVARVRPTSELASEFLEAYLRSDTGQRSLSMVLVGTTRAEVSIGVLAQLRVPVPAPQVQRKVVDLDTAASDRIKAEVSCLESLEQIRRGLSADLLSGRVRTVMS